MKRLLLLSFILGGCSVFAPLQKSKLITVYHLIETARYTEAKTVVEEMIDDEESSQWANTWYVRGLLCETAYREGIKKNDKKLYELYPKQLYVAYESYEKALSLDHQGKFDKQLPPRYVILANDFQVSGIKHFNNKQYIEALKAFEHALKITESPLLAVQTDTSLIYNAALAAYESKNREKAIKYLSILHDYGYSANVAHLLFDSYLESGDATMAERVLIEGAERYKDNENLIILLSDFLHGNNRSEKALETLENAILKNPSSFKFHYTKGLILQKNGQFNKAIDTYKEAVKLSPDEIMPCLNIATCYYNIGVEIEENTRILTNSHAVQAEKDKSAMAFESAVSWLDRAYNKKPADPAITMKIYDLYKQLRVMDKVTTMDEQNK